MPFQPRMMLEDEDVCRAAQLIFVFRDDAWAIRLSVEDMVVGNGEIGCWWGGGARWGVIRSGMRMLGWSLWKFFLRGRMGGLEDGEGGCYEEG